MTKTNKARVKRIEQISEEIKRVKTELSEQLAALAMYSEGITKLGEKDDADSNYARSVIVTKIINFRVERVDPILEQMQSLTEELRSVFAKVRFEGREEIRKEFGI